MKISAQGSDEFFQRILKRAPDEILSFLLRPHKTETKLALKIDFEDDSDANHAWYIVGCALEKQGQSHLASAAFLRAIRYWNEDSDAYVAYSNTEADAKKQIPVLEKGLELVNDPRIRFNLANAYLDLNDVEMALTHLKKIESSWEKYNLVCENMLKLQSRRNKISPS